MQTIKILLGILCVVMCSYLGGQKSSKYKKRLSFWRELKIINDKMITNQLTDKESVIDVLEKTKSEISKDFILKIKGGDISFDYGYIDENDLEIVSNYVKSLGRGTSNEQSVLYAEFGKIITDKIKLAETDDKKYSSTCTKLGFLIGVAIFIIIL